MISVVDEIKRLRSGKMRVDYNNNNRYCAVLDEDNGSKTAYYFTTPIYNIKTRRAIDLRFLKTDTAINFFGSNSIVTINNDITMQSDCGSCRVLMQEPVTYVCERKLKCGNSTMYPTTNGLMFSTASDKITFEIQTEAPIFDIRYNEKYFSVMSEKFRPFITVSCIGAADRSGNIIAPAKISYRKSEERKITATVSACDTLAEKIMYEINMYEPKLIQDTTVESNNPTANNSFGSMAFIGNTRQYGEQWLYSRLDHSKLPELIDRRVLKAVLYIPQYNLSNMPLGVFKVAARFCSFGSNWNNKIPASQSIATSESKDRYLNIDITRFLSDDSGRMVYTDGIIVKPQLKEADFCAIATADSCYTPQIVEINYR
mgnify:CR=1 FL=1